MFHFLAIMNNVPTVSVCGTYALISLGHVPRGLIAGSYSKSIFYLLKNYHTLPKQLHHFISSPAMGKSSHCSISSSTLVLSIFDHSYAGGCEVASHCGFELLFLTIGDIEHLFMLLLAICMSSLEDCPLPICVILIYLGGNFISYCPIL